MKGLTITFINGGARPVLAKDLDPIGIIGPEGGEDAFPDGGPQLYVHKRVNQYRTDIIWYENGKLKRRKVMLHRSRA